LDDLRNIRDNGKDYLLKIQEREIEKTGISSLKVGYNNVFGYYLEVRNTFKDKVPEDWIRKQTLVSAERYITQELKEYEEKILGADERIQVMENDLYTAIDRLYAGLYFRDPIGCQSYRISRLSAVFCKSFE
jgi:DNA mismatch repair protein MutS